MHQYRCGDHRRVSKKDMRVGFIGLGQMGGAMAGRIMASGYPLKVWARRAGSMAQLLSGGAAKAANIAELGATCDYVGLCVLDDAAVAEVCDALIPAMRAGSLLAIHSTIAPESCEMLEARCGERGILFVDAPVDGSGPQALAGELVVMCGGTEEAVAMARPVLESFGRLVVHLGPVGAGQRAKIICNAMLAADLGLARAAMNLGDRFGLDRAQLHEVLINGAAQSNGLSLFPSLTGPRPAPLHHKDTALMREAGNGNPHSELIAQTAQHWLDAAKARV